jgi:hypothetical protein
LPRASLEPSPLYCFTAHTSQICFHLLHTYKHRDGKKNSLTALGFSLNASSQHMDGNMQRRLCEEVARVWGKPKTKLKGKRSPVPLGLGPGFLICSNLWACAYFHDWISVFSQAMNLEGSLCSVSKYLAIIAAVPSD